MNNIQEKQSSEQHVENIIKQHEDREKSQHSKNAIVAFIIFTFVLLFINNESLNTFATVLFFFIGMFIVSILSIPSFLLKMFIAKKITVEQTLQLRKIYWLVELLYNFAMTYILFKIFLNIIKI